MALNRKTVNFIRYVLEDVIPPFIRDSFLFLPLMHLVFKENTAKFIRFRQDLLSMKTEDYSEYYSRMKPVMGETDLNEACITRIIKGIRGSSIVDVGCGRGYLANQLGSNYPHSKVFGIDMDVSSCRPQSDNVSFKCGMAEDIPLGDKSFDTVVCTHTLEHIQNLDKALGELRRISRKRLIIVVPREREYKYSFNFHVNFFPYKHSFLNRISPPIGSFICEVLDGDIYYLENLEPGI